MLVKDYSGKLIPKSKARKIKNDRGEYEYYETGVSCIKMDDGRYYRTTTGKIIFDHSLGKWVYSNSFKGNFGFIDGDKEGYFSKVDEIVKVKYKKLQEVDILKIKVDGSATVKEKTKAKIWSNGICINEETAIKNGYVESLKDGIFYKLSDCTPGEIDSLKEFGTPKEERSNTYSLDDDPKERGRLEELYDNNIKIKPNLKLAKYARLIPFTFGVEIEVNQGHVPARLREPLGFRVCRDGSLGEEGKEYVSIPLEGSKGLMACKMMCEHLKKRTNTSNKCSVHIHFGDVRRDKLYLVSLYNLIFHLQTYYKFYFPYSRTNSIRDDGKVYAKDLQDVNLKVDDILGIKEEEEFKKRILEEFNKIYTYLNNGRSLGEKYKEEFIKDTREVIIRGKKVKQYAYRTKEYKFTTAIPHHAIQGQKWQRNQRYHNTNFLNLFFAKSGTVEFRIHEATINFDKILAFMLTNVAILKYAENFSKTLDKKKVSKITLEEILHSELPKELAENLMSHWTKRRETFTGSSTGVKFLDYKLIEETYRREDKTFKLTL